MVSPVYKILKQQHFYHMLFTVYLRKWITIILWHTHICRENMSGVIMSGQTASASLLVEAALESAERELRRPQQTLSPPAMIPRSPTETPLVDPSPPPKMVICSPPPPMTMEHDVMRGPNDQQDIMHSSQEESRRSTPPTPHYVSVSRTT